MSKRSPATPKKVSQPNAQLSLPIPVDADRRIRRLAHQRGVTLAKLVRPWVIERLAQEEALETTVPGL